MVGKYHIYGCYGIHVQTKYVSTELLAKGAFKFEFMYLDELINQWPYLYKPTPEIQSILYTDILIYTDTQ